MARKSLDPGIAPTGIGGDTSKTINVKWEANFTELYKAMGAVLGGVNSGADGAVLPTALPIANGGTGAITAAAALLKLLPTATTGQFVKFDGTNWVAAADNNTTYSNMSAAEITAGTATTGRLITPKDLKTAVGTYNAATASKLLNPVKINGTDFDGTQDINIASMPMGVPIFHGGLRSTIETGYVAYDGQLLNRADYPAMWAKVQATFPLITDADWLANPSKRGSYSSSDGTTTFRMPDYNGVQTDSLKGLFLRGDGGGTIGDVAVSSGTTVLSDAIRNITGSLWNGDNWNLPNAAGAGVFTADNQGCSAPINGREYLATAGGWTFNASRQVPTAAENRPVSAVGIWICRVGNTLTEVANPTLHAVLTGGNTFSGTQKMEAVEFNDSTVIRGLVNDLTTGGIDKALTAEMGKALAGSAFGVNQTIVTMNGLRSLGITYTNSTNKPILVCATGITTNNAPTTVLYVNVNEVAYTKLMQVGGAWASISFIVPPSGTYLINVEGNVGFSLQIWKEFKA